MLEQNLLAVGLSLSATAVILCRYMIIKPDHIAGSSGDANPTEVVLRHIKILVALRMAIGSTNLVVGFNAALMVALTAIDFTRKTHEYELAVLVATVFVLGGAYLSYRLRDSFDKGVMLLDIIDNDQSILDSAIKTEEERIKLDK